VVLVGPNDIVCGRCRTAYHNVGNHRFRATIYLYLQRYNEARSREDKGNAIKSVVRILLEDVGARFLKKRGNTWVEELGEKKAREKVGHALRDMSVQEQQERRRYHIAKKNKEQQSQEQLVNSSSSAGGDFPMVQEQQHIVHEEEENNSTTMLLLERKIAPMDAPLALAFLESMDALFNLCTDYED
jgi:hypothetical protein